MASAEAIEDITPQCRIIANQAAELVTLQHKLNRLEDIGKRYSSQKKLLDDAIKAKHALQEVFFNTVQEKRSLISDKKELQLILADKDYILKECKQDNSLEVESIKRLFELEISSLKESYVALQSSSECCMDTMQTEYSFKHGLSAIKHSTLNTKYKFIKSENKVLKKELKSFKTQLSLMSLDNKILREYEDIIVSLLFDAQKLQQTLDALSNKCLIELNAKQSLLRELIADNDIIRTMYHRLAQIVSNQDNKITRIITKNNKLNTIIEHNDIQNGRMQKHFQKDIANKERSIVKLESKLETLSSNVSLKQKQEILNEQIISLKNERDLLKQEIKHLNDNLRNKDDYIEALKKQIADNNDNISKLHDENAAMQSINQSVQNQMNIKYNKLNDKYEGNLVKLQKMADKLKEQIVGRKKMKKQYIETKQELQKLFKDNERIERETDKQCDAVQQSMEQYKKKIVKKNKEIHALNDALKEIETENREYKEEMLLLQKENDNHKFLIEHLEIDNNEQSKLAQKARHVRKKNRSVFNQIINENNYSQNECKEVLKEIEHEDKEKENQDEDDDLNVDRLSGTKRPRDDDNEDNNNDEEQDIIGDLPPKKKAKLNHNNKTDATPIKGNKGIFRARKKRNKANNGNLPAPKIK